MREYTVYKLSVNKMIIKKCKEIVMSQAKNKDILPFPIYFILPVVLIALLYVSKGLGPDYYALYAAKEEGAIEWITVLFLLICAVVTWKIRGQGNLPNQKFMRPLGLLIILGCIFVVGEELSWGQHIIGWEVSNSYAEINKQQESNIHNLYAIGDYMDKYPRAILSISIAIYAFFGFKIYKAGFMKNLREQALVQLIEPSKVVIPAAIMVIGPRLINRLQVWFKFELPYAFQIPSKDYQEFQELAIITFAMIFLMMVYARLKRDA